MTLMIDPPAVPSRGRWWSHLASDESYDELHAFARELGIPERGFDRDHYDVPSEWYDEVLALGVEPVSSRELVRRLVASGLRRRKGSRAGLPIPGGPDAAQAALGALPTLRRRPVCGRAGAFPAPPGRRRHHHDLGDTP